VIGDISGHGVSAALFSVFVGVALRRAYREALAPHRILTRLNRELFENLPKSYFVTMLCWSFDALHSEITWANAGHPPPLIMTEGKARELGTAKYPALGVRFHEEYTSETMPFNAGDGLVAYTDGVLDAFKDQQYTIDMTMSDFLQQSANSRIFFSRMRDYLDKQTGFIDDRSLMVLSSGI
jgi:phosphoserine phosphatase RsbU/P